MPHSGLCLEQTAPAGRCLTAVPQVKWRSRLSLTPGPPASCCLCCIACLGLLSSGGLHLMFPSLMFPCQSLPYGTGEPRTCATASSESKLYQKACAASAASRSVNIADLVSMLQGVGVGTGAAGNPRMCSRHNTWAAVCLRCEARPNKAYFTPAGTYNFPAGSANSLVGPPPSGPAPSGNMCRAAALRQRLNQIVCELLCIATPTKSCWL